MKTKTTNPTKRTTTKRKSNKIRNAMEVKGLRPDEVAVLAICGVATVYRILRSGELPANRNTRASVCRVLGLKDAES